MTLGILNSRMKDYYDFWFLRVITGSMDKSWQTPFVPPSTDVAAACPSDTPIGFSDSFWSDPSRR